jgi:hypothetical protein
VLGRKAQFSVRFRVLSKLVASYTNGGLHLESYLGKHGKLNTGVGHTGVVEGIQKATTWLFNGTVDIKRCTEWNEKAPGWENDYLLTIRLDHPCRSCTLEQFKIGVGKQCGKDRVDELTVEEIEEWYKKEVKYCFYVSCPIQLFKLTETRYTEN